MTRFLLSTILDGSILTRTLPRDENETREVQDNWIVTFIQPDEHGVLNIYCEHPEKFLNK